MMLSNPDYFKKIDGEGVETNEETREQNGAGGTCGNGNCSKEGWVAE